jgi:hypothetical protein
MNNKTSSSPLLTSSKRPGPDITDVDRPMASHLSAKNNSNSCESTGNIHSINSSKITDRQNAKSLPVISKQEDSDSKSSLSLILRDKEPDLYTINNSTESEELDAMIAAIDSSGSDNKFPQIPLPKKTKGSTSRSMMHRSRSKKLNSQSSPTLHVAASQQSSPSMHSGSPNSVPSMKLSPSQHDSPSVHDPTSYMISHNEQNSSIDLNLGTANQIATDLVLPFRGERVNIEPPITALSSTTDERLYGRRGRSRQQTQYINASTKEVVTIPETAQQRRKARSQSRGRRIRERARILLSSYEATKIASDDHPTPEFERNEQSTLQSIPPIVHSTTMDSGSESIESNTLPRAFERRHSTLSLRNDTGRRSSHSPRRSRLTKARSLYSGNKFFDNLVDNNAFTFYPSEMEMDHFDRLSDIPSDVDPLLREQYLKACRILKSSLLGKDAMMRPSEKAFLSQLLKDTTPSNEDSECNAFHTEGEKRIYKSTGPNTLLEQSATLLGAASTDFNSYPTTDISDDNADNAVVTVKRGLRRATTQTANNHSISTAESSTQESQILNNVMKDDYNIEDTYHTKDRQDNTFKTTASIMSSAMLNGVIDDYPYKALGLDGRSCSSVLSPWMMNVFRGFFPFEINNHNFWLKYQLDRSTDINHDDNANLMTLLWKIQHDTYTMFCVETVDGCVFGAFCSAPWKIHLSWYGSGDSSFLWRLKHPRRGERSIDSQSRDLSNENDIEIYPYTRSDSFVQYCSNQTLAVGGGTDWSPTFNNTVLQQLSDESTASGIGFLLDGDLMGGESNTCVTYANPPLGKKHGIKNSKKTNEFDVQTLEVYTFSNTSQGADSIG